MTLLVTRPRRALDYRSERELQAFQERMSQLTRDIFGELFPAAGGAAAGATPPVDIEETDDAFRVDVDLPDVAPDDLRVDLRDSELRVAGRYRTRERTGTLRHHSRKEGEFEYLIELPADVDAERVEADLDSGVLSITAPKAGEQQARRIEVHHHRAAQPQPGRPPETPAAKAKQLRDGAAGIGSTGQVGRSSMA